MSSAFVQLVDVIAAAHAADTAFAGCTITSRLQALPPAGALRILDVRQVETRGTSRFSGHPMDWETTIAITAKARAAGGDTPDDVLDAMLLASASVLSMLDVDGLAVMSWDADSRVRWGVQQDKPDQPPYAYAQRVLRISHRTDATTLAPQN